MFERRCRIADRCVGSPVEVVAARASRFARRLTGRGRPGRSKGTRGGSFARSAIPLGAGRPAPAPSRGCSDSSAGAAPPTSRHAAGVRCTRHGAPRGSAGTTGFADREPHRPIGPVPSQRGRHPEPPRSGSEGSSPRRTPTTSGSGRPPDPAPGHQGVPNRVRTEVGPGREQPTPAEHGRRPEQDPRPRPVAAPRLQRPGPAPLQEARPTAGSSGRSGRIRLPKQPGSRMAPDRQRNERFEARWRAWRSARARIVSVGLAWPPLGKVELPASQRLATP